MHVYIGTYSTRGSQGVYLYEFDPVTGQLADTGQRGAAASPSFLAFSRDGSRLYCANEDWSKPQGAATAFAVDPDTGALTLLNAQSAEGSGPCHVAISPDGATLVLANYGSGSAVSLPIAADGSLGAAASVQQHEGSGPNAKRQERPHAHSATFAPDGQRVYVCDLGVDRIFIYTLDAEGRLQPNGPAWADVHAGAGPRHMTFSTDGTRAYVINELDSTVSLFTVDSATGALTEQEYVTTLKPDGAEANSCADLHLHPNGRWLYGSNRGDDSIVVYSVHAGTGRLSLVQHISTDGQTPRNFGLDPSGRWLIVANQDSDNLVVFAIDQTNGKLTRQKGDYSVPAPVCVRFAPVSSGGAGGGE